MSEVGDRERRFVEDQRALEAATACCGDYWSDYPVVCAGCPMLSYNRRTDHKDALLTEAAEALRELRVRLFRLGTHGDVLWDIEDWWNKDAKPLLSKIEGELDA